MRVFTISLIFSGMVVNAAPPDWWTAGDPPVVDVTNTDPQKNHGMASIGQAKWMVSEALRALEDAAPGVAGEVRDDIEEIIDLSVPFPKTPEWQDMQKAPLLLGQLKAIAAPFYENLHAFAPDWLDHESTVEAEKGQLQLNGTKDAADPANFHPWSSATGDDANNAPATIGQLKAVFSLRFEDMPGELDTDLDGLPDWLEAELDTDPDNPDTDGDGAPDGVENKEKSDPKSEDSVPEPDPLFVTQIVQGASNEDRFPPLHTNYTAVDSTGISDFFYRFASFDAATLANAIKTYGFRDFSNRDSIRSIINLGAFQGVTIRNEGGGLTSYGSSSFACSQQKSFPPGGTDLGTTLAAATAANVRLENNWKANADRAYAFKRIHLKAAIPSSVTRQRMGKGDILWKIPIEDYTEVEDEEAESIVKLTISKGQTVSSAYEIEAPEIEEGYFHLIFLVPIQVNWQQIADYNNVDDHVDPWGKNIGGKRIFPCHKNPNDNVSRDKLEVVVKTSPYYAGKTVHLKAFDVDDSTSESFDMDLDETANVIDVGGRSGNDNFPDFKATPLSGQFWSGSVWGGDTITATLDENGRAKVVFGVGMQPGNNYRIVASVDDTSMYAGVQTGDSEAEKYLGPEGGQTGGAPATELLTVWRKLWVENDSMEEIPRDEFDYKQNHLTSDNPSAHIRSLQLLPGSQTELRIDNVTDTSSFLGLENGSIIVQGESHSVINTSRNIFDRVVISGDHMDIPINSGFRLYDDDDFGLFQEALPRVNLAEEVVAEKEVMKDVFRPAFIEVVDAGKYNNERVLPFYRNYAIGPVYEGIYDDKIESRDDEELWWVSLIAAYQGEVGADNDPDSESESEGQTPRVGADFSIVFVETVREGVDGLLRNPASNKTALNNEIRRNIILTAAHEIGHHPQYSQGNSHHDENGLMGSDGYGNATNFFPPSILRFRKTFHWTQAF